MDQMTPDFENSVGVHAASWAEAFSCQNISNWKQLRSSIFMLLSLQEIQVLVAKELLLNDPPPGIVAVRFCLLQHLPLPRAEHESQGWRCSLGLGT